MQVLQEAVRGRQFMLFVGQIEYTNEGEIQEDWFGSKSVSKYKKSFVLTSLTSEDEKIDIKINLDDSGTEFNWFVINGPVHKRTTQFIVARAKSLLSWVDRIQLLCNIEPESGERLCAQHPPPHEIINITTRLKLSKLPAGSGRRWKLPELSEEISSGHLVVHLKII